VDPSKNGRFWSDFKSFVNLVKMPPEMWYPAANNIWINRRDDQT